MSTAQRFDGQVTMSDAVDPWLHRVPAVIQSNTAREAWRKFRPLIPAIAIRVLPGPTKILSYAWATAYALLGRRQAIMSLALLWFFNLFTHAFGNPPPAAAMFRHLTVFAAAASVFIIYVSVPPRSRVPGFLIWTGVMSFLLVVHSIVFSRMPDISILKALSYSMTIQLLLTAWSRLSPLERSVTEGQVWGLLCGVVVGGTPLLFLPQGYFKNGRGFQGLLEHPQTLGPIAAIVAVWLLTTLLTDRRVGIWSVATLALSFVSVYCAQARIGVVVFIVGMVTALIASPIAAVVNRTGRASRILKLRLAFLLVVLFGVLVAVGPLLSTKARQFILKTSKSETAIDAAWESRGFLIEMMQQNIRENPMTGIGFGVASNPQLYSAVVRDPIFGLAIMATVEKGVLPVAIVEELGWPLALLYAPWFLALLVMAIRAGPRYAGVCAAALAMNLSECVFFSPGGGGLIVQILVTMAATASSNPQGRTS